jgi:hypothetical protein
MLMLSLLFLTCNKELHLKSAEAKNPNDGTEGVSRSSDKSLGWRTRS